MLTLFTLLFSICLALSIPLSDVLAIRYVADKQLDYGKSRLWGSVGFLVGTLVAGYAIDYAGYDVILWIMIAGLVVTLGYAMKTPFPAISTAKSGTSSSSWTLKRILLNREVQWLLLVTSIIHGSHAALYGFSVIHWQRLGIDPAVIGYFWALGVVAEVILFNFAWWFREALSVRAMLVVASLGVVVRWWILGAASQIELILFAQTLHAFTFGICHIAVTQYIQMKPQAMSIPLQAVYNALPASAAIGLMTSFTGFYFDDFGGGVFYGMAAMGLVALLLCAFQPKP